MLFELESFISFLVTISFPLLFPSYNTLHPHDPPTHTSLPSPPAASQPALRASKRWILQPALGPPLPRPPAPHHPAPRRAAHTVPIPRHVPVHARPDTHVAQCGPRRGAHGGGCDDLRAVQRVAGLAGGGCGRMRVRMEMWIERGRARGVPCWRWGRGEGDFHLLAWAVQRREGVQVQRVEVRVSVVVVVEEAVREGSVWVQMLR